jgi:hypothetical protein
VERGSFDPGICRGARGLAREAGVIVLSHPSGRMPALEFVWKSVKRFSEKTHEKNKELKRAFDSIKSV